MSDDKTNYSYGVGSYLFVQCALFVICFGFNKPLPWWALWFPSLLCGGILVIVLLVLLIVGIVSWLTTR